MMKKKLLPILLTLAMTLGVMTNTAFAAKADYQDVSGHWGESSIERWSNYGIMEGFDGQFMPNKDMTRAEMAAMLVRLLGLTDKAENKFTDVDEQQWYADAVLKCAAAGIMQGSDGKANPNGKITRQEAAVMLGRALNIKPVEGELSFNDGQKVAGWASGYVKALADKNIVGGVGNNTFAPVQNIDRASVTKILDNAISGYTNTEGETLQANGEGITLVAAPNVTVTGQAADMLVSAGAKGSDVSVSGATVSGTLTVAAPETTVTLSTSTKVESAVVAESAEQSKIVVEKTAAVGSVTAEAPKAEISVSGTVDNVTATANASESKVEVAKGATVGTVTTEAPKGEVSVSGKVDKVETSSTASDAKVDVAKDATVGEIAVAGENTGITVSGKVDNVTVSDTASNTKVDTATGSTIGKVDNAAEGTTVSGSGKVENVTTSGDNTTVSTPGTKVDVSEGTNGTTAGGKDVAGGESTTTKPSTPSGGGGGGGDVHSHSYANEWSKDVDYHWHACACGAVSDKAAHTWNEGEVTKEATCTEKGIKTYTCSVCNATRTEEIAALGHVWDEGVVTTHAVNGKDGVKTYTCIRACGETKTEPVAMKFYFGVTSNENTVDMTVGEDYTAVVTVPESGSKVNTESVTISAKMKDVASLGVTGLRQHEVTLNTGDTLGNHDVVLSGWLDSCYKFSGATINATIDGKACSYNFAGISDTKIVAAPNSTEAACAAWQALTRHIENSTQAQDDSKIIIKNGSYIKIGTEHLHFEESYEGDLTLNNFNDLDALQTAIRTAVKLDTNQTDQGGKITLFVKAGTQLAVGQSIATLEDDCKIEINVDADELDTSEISLETLRNQTTVYTMVQELVKMFDNVVGVIDASGTVTVNMSFTPAAE